MRTLITAFLCLIHLPHAWAAEGDDIIGLLNPHHSPLGGVVEATYVRDFPLQSSLQPYAEVFVALSMADTLAKVHQALKVAHVEPNPTRGDIVNAWKLGWTNMEEPRYTDP